jgi:hypothetical protein
MMKTGAEYIAAEQSLMKNNGSGALPVVLRPDSPSLSAGARPQNNGAGVATRPALYRSDTAVPVRTDS